MKYGNVDRLMMWFTNTQRFARMTSTRLGVHSLTDATAELFFDMCFTSGRITYQSPDRHWTTPQSIGLTPMGRSLM